MVLAGGAGRRIGGDKATVELRGLPLLHYPLRALAAVTSCRAVVAKADSVLPRLPPDVVRWVEPDEPRHPLTGIRHALRAAAGASVLCCAVDLPLLDAATLRALLAADGGQHACVVPRVADRLEPLCALWHPRALTTLDASIGSARMRDVVRSLDPLEVPFADGRPFTNVNVLQDVQRLQRDAEA